MGYFTALTLEICRHHTKLSTIAECLVLKGPAAVCVSTDCRTREKGTIKNVIEEDDRGELYIRFTYTIEVEGIIPDSEQERELMAKLENNYVKALNNTLNTIRAMVRAGRL